MRKLVVCALGITTLLLALPATGSAGLLTTGSASYCDEAEQPFQPWGDNAYYILVPGGSFETGTPRWALSGGAEIVAGNEPFRVEGADDSRSLRIPAGGSATSPLVCFAFGDWHMRFFTKNAGTRLSSLEVDIIVPSLIGVLSVLDGGNVRADGTWDPSPKVSALVSNVGGLAGTTRAVAFRFKSSMGASFQIDDVYLDPFKSH